MVGDQEQQGENRAGISPELSDMTFLNSTRSREPGRGANRKHAPDRRTVVQRNCMNVFAAMGVFAISLVIVSGQSSGLCPEKMYAPPESGQDSYDDCICSPGAVTRDWEDEACTFYKLEKDRACRQDSLDWVYLDSADSPAQCMHLVMDDGSSCRRQDFFLWRVRGDKSCYCPGGSGPAAVDQCTYPVLYLMDASTYTIESAFVQGGKPENGSHLTSCFNLTALSLCELCPAGTFTNETDSIYSTDVCTPCPAGSYSSLIGANASSFCMPCGRGNYSEQTGMVSIDSCMACPGGTYSPVLVVDSRSKCISCASGYYSEQVGAISNDTCVQV